MTQVVQPNRKLIAVMKEAGVQNHGLADRMQAASRIDGGKAVKTSNTNIAKYKDGRTAQPTVRVCEVMLKVLGELVKRDLTPSDIGFPDVKVDVKSNLAVVESFEDPLLIAERLQRIGEIDVDDSVLDIVEFAVDDIIDRYEVEGPARLSPAVISIRRRVDELTRQRRHPKQLQHLYELAAKLSGMLSYMAVNRGRFPLARAYAKEAFYVSDLIDDSQLKAWIKGTESFCAYYMGKYAMAAALAEEGIRYAPNSPQAIRLLSNGLARALGKMGDLKGVHVAIDRAGALAEALAVPDGLTPALTFDPYGHARLAANAATAYLAAGDLERTLQFGHQVESLVDESDSVWSRSLVRLDIATALVKLASPDIEQAAHLGAEALTFSEERPIRSVWQRAHEFGAATESFDSSEAREYHAVLRAWAERARDFSASAKAS
ncbi:transcriptional regulator [Nocardia huaxiensis]|uniref:Transcriptional regulator n=1 Tax=Nocardia huaxiensis TaxID=2755382 RepID=A0A7D6VDI7_9NOCA|nr:transcriptional regulator [Nocardia huaxiensis]QLY33952.1 transcriptional regulator [Nocardia huaxiensis]